MSNRNFSRYALLAGVLASLLFVQPGVQAQWIWQDANGQRVISDMPPPAEVPDKNILRRPGPARSAPSPSTDPALAATPGASTDAPATPGTPGTPTAAKPAADSPEVKKAELERQAIEKRNAQIMADNCQRARDSAATLQSNRRLAMVNEKGQNVVMDEAMRKAEMARLQQIIKDNCKK